MNKRQRWEARQLADGKCGSCGRRQLAKRSARKCATCLRKDRQRKSAREREKARVRVQDVCTRLGMVHRTVLGMVHDVAR